MRRCESVQKKFKIKHGKHRGEKRSFTAAVGETCIPKWKRPSAKQTAWRKVFRKASSSCPRKVGKARSACMKRALQAHG